MNKDNGIEIIYDYAVHKDTTPEQPTGMELFKDSMFSVFIDSLGVAVIGIVCLIINFT